MNRRLPLRTLVLAVFGALLALAAVACSSDDDVKAVDQTTTSSTAESAEASTTIEDEDASDPTDETDDPEAAASSGDLTLPDAVEVSALMCSNSEMSLGDQEAAAAGEVDCGEVHDSEALSISGAGDLDDCYRVIAEFSDVVIVVDEDSELDIDDDRVSGHSFGGYDGEYECQISLAEPRTEPLIDR